MVYCKSNASGARQVGRRDLLKHIAALGALFATGPGCDRQFGNFADSPELVLWSGTVRNELIRDRLLAAHAGRFEKSTIFPIQFRADRDSGLSEQDIHSIIVESGIGIKSVDPVTTWLPSWEAPEELDDYGRAFLDVSLDEIFHIAEVVRAETLNLIHPFQTVFPINELADAFGAVCDRAALSGLTCHIEFMPYGGIPDLKAAWDVVRAADRSNGGILFDTWHYYRGNPDHALLRSLPGEKIFQVQVSDALLEIQGSLLEDTLRNRRPPGQGELDLITVLRVLHEIGGLRVVGPEIFSEDIYALDPVSVGRLSGDTVREVLRAATA